jgi:uncharacterized protein YsxB (DUF464 family)
MIKAQTRDIENGIILELTGHADPVEGEPPGLGSRVCSGVSCFCFALSTYTNRTPDPPGSGFLHLCLMKEHFHLMPFILHFLCLMQATYPEYIELCFAHTKGAE